MLQLCVELSRPLRNLLSSQRTLFELIPSGYTRNTPFIPIDLTDNDFLDVMILLGKYGIRRVFTVDAPGGDILSVISQVCVSVFVPLSLDDENWR